MSNQQEIARAEEALMKKYRLQRRLLYLFRRVAISLRRGVYERIYLAIEA